MAMVPAGGELTVNGRAFTAVKLLGKGKSGYSYLVTDGETQYVIKQIHHEPCDYYAFGDKVQAERCAYERLSAAGVPVPKLLDVDADAERLLKEYVPGPTVMNLVRSDSLPPVYLARIREICACCYAAGMNIDYFPTNFIAAGGALTYIDYECNEYAEEWSFERWGVRYWSKTPEFLAYIAEHGE